MSTTWLGSELWQVPPVQKANSDGSAVEDVPKSHILLSLPFHVIEMIFRMSCGSLSGVSPLCETINPNGEDKLSRVLCCSRSGSGT